MVRAPTSSRGSAPRSTAKERVINRGRRSRRRSTQRHTASTCFRGSISKSAGFIACSRNMAEKALRVFAGQLLALALGIVLVFVVKIRGPRTPTTVGSPAAKAELAIGVRLAPMKKLGRRVRSQKFRQPSVISLPSCSRATKRSESVSETYPHC